MEINLLKIMRSNFATNGSKQRFLKGKELRYFIFSSVYTGERSSLISTNFGITRNSFPSNKELQEIVKSNKKDNYISNIVVLSICEVTKEDYNTFWGDSLK